MLRVLEYCWDPVMPVGFSLRTMAALSGTCRTLYRFVAEWGWQELVASGPEQSGTVQWQRVKVVRVVRGAEIPRDHWSCLSPHCHAVHLEVEPRQLQVFQDLKEFDLLPLVRSVVMDGRTNSEALAVFLSMCTGLVRLRLNDFDFTTPQWDMIANNLHCLRNIRLNLMRNPGVPLSVLCVNNPKLQVIHLRKVHAVGKNDYIHTVRWPSTLLSLHLERVSLVNVERRQDVVAGLRWLLDRCPRLNEICLEEIYARENFDRRNARLYVDENVNELQG
jgi:hypothetical protein